MSFIFKFNKKQAFSRYLLDIIPLLVLILPKFNIAEIVLNILLYFFLPKIKFYKGIIKFIKTGSIINPI